MKTTEYLIVGSSHAALEAITAIRQHDETGGITLVTRDSYPPYSPTVLPYIVSGRSRPERVQLREDPWFEEQGIEFIRREALVHVDEKASIATFASGMQRRYDKLLLATGSRPLLPDIAGLADVPYHVLRSLDDALGMRDAITPGQKAIVLGAGLVGMHAAENLLEGGMEVEIVERGDSVLPAYFDERAGRMIGAAFNQRGVRLHFGHGATAVSATADGGIALVLDSGERLEGDLLVVAVGVRAVMDYLDDGDIETHQGILVDDRMRTSAPRVWAAGDCAEARAFHGGRTIAGILPSAVDQGRVAGADMAGDRVTGYVGSIPLNTYTFFGQQAISVGAPVVSGSGVEVYEDGDDAGKRYRRIVLADGRLVAAAGINEGMDGGVLRQLILRQVDLTPVKASFVSRPRETARHLMSQIWR